jgi:TRAP-type C4-dicarboxylate transport system permease small subunit
MKFLLNLLHGLMASLNFIGAIWVFLIVLLITADVLGRAFFNSPLHGVPEIVKVSIVGLVWCQMAYTLKTGAHLRTTILLDRMPLAPRRVIEIVTCLLGAIMFALIVYSGWGNMLEAWRIGEFEGEEPARIPTSPIRTLVLIGAALTAIQFLVMLVDVIRGKTLDQAEGEF